MPAEPPDLTRVASRLAHILGEEHTLLVGGLAVAVHGYVRATDDVDVLTRRSLAQALGLLHASGIRAVLRRGDPLEGDFSCIRGTLEGVKFDVLPELVPIDWENAIQLKQPSLRVVDLQGLLRLKLRAGGPQDLMDAALLVLHNPDHLAEAREAARAQGLGDRFEAWLSDPRVNSQVRQDLEGRGAEGRRILRRLAKVARVRGGPRTRSRR